MTVSRAKLIRAALWTLYVAVVLTGTLSGVRTIQARIAGVQARATLNTDDCESACYDVPTDECCEICGKATCNPQD